MPQPPSIAVMAHVLITGPADGLGLMARAQPLARALLKRPARRLSWA